MSGWNSPVRGWAMPLADTVAIKGPYRIDCDVGDLAVCYDLWRMQIGMSVERYLRAWPVGMLALHETTGDAGRVFTLWVRAKGGAQHSTVIWARRQRGWPAAHKRGRPSRWRDFEPFPGPHPRGWIPDLADPFQRAYATADDGEGLAAVGEEVREHLQRARELFENIE